MITSVLVNIEATVRDCGMIYKAAVPSVMLYISESWLVMGEMLKILEGFHQR